ncbi:hypothetical protein [Nostoc sphaeroides]|uniref:Uncharacterized protein n=1 Tax=Nostoc sphaeroides CCNUC1 TaxID=2653204 RepID=A0A5P8W880_9NOSO|nr:hypothetical protein [Nostoc sphaeroides]QFS48973.1 hypothetical protein GXM_06467 [Nostoc sphaeroides CCNUC1]
MLSLPMDGTIGIKFDNLEKSVVQLGSNPATITINRKSRFDHV